MNINDHLEIETEGQVSPVQRQKKLADSIYARALEMQTRITLAEQTLASADACLMMLRSKMQEAESHGEALRKSAQELCADAAFLTSELRVRP